MDEKFNNDEAEKSENIENTQNGQTNENNDDNLSENDVVSVSDDVIKVAQIEQPFNLGKEIFEWVYTIAIALLIAFLVKAFVFDVVKVDGSSMYPTLVNNDRLIVTKLGYKPKNGDIIILDSLYKSREKYVNDLEKSTGSKMNTFQKIEFKFTMPSYLKPRYYVKRIIAVAGQTVNLVDGKVVVDGKILDEPYYKGNTYTIDSMVKFPLKVSDDSVFVMGDNRGNSKDSRSSELGQVPYEAILGKSQVRIWPINALGLTM